MKTAYVFLGLVFAAFLIAGCGKTGQATKVGDNGNTCFDSDGGNAPDIFGWVYGNQENMLQILFNISDSCVNSTTVNESNCHGNSAGTAPSFIYLNCNNGKVCQNGKCAGGSPILFKEATRPVTTSGSD